MTIDLHLHTQLESDITIRDIPEEKLDSAIRYYGERGWYSGAIPHGGFMLPYDNHHDFDWRLIGGHTFEAVDKATGEKIEGVYCRGHFWKRRDLAANPKKNMVAAVKYSRGAKPTDEPHLIEGDESGFRYVTLAIFRGGRRNEHYAIPK